MLESYLNDIKAEILKMAGHVEVALQASILGLRECDEEALNKTFAAEDQINSLHRQIDLTCFKLLARQAPKASDLRLILAIMKINTDLERMGDLACNIGHYVREIIAFNEQPVGIDLGPLTDNVLWMVSKAIESLMNGSVEVAQSVLERDDIVDQLKDENFQLTKQEIKQKPNILNSGLDIILVARNLERIADHATNIAEDVIFVTTGRDVRHGTHDEFNS